MLGVETSFGLELQNWLRVSLKTGLGLVKSLGLGLDTGLGLGRWLGLRFCVKFRKRVIFRIWFREKGYDNRIWIRDSMHGKHTDGLGLALG